MNVFAKKYCIAYLFALHLQCICCQTKGYDPSMPDHIGEYEGNLGAYNIKKYFKPLSINDDGLCEQCSKMMKN